MTPPAREEYITDVPYVRAFVADLSPVMLRLVAALNGFSPPSARELDYCELGSAHGDTTATLAAAYPNGRFLGVDLNPTHIASANALASEGELPNARFLERDFEDLAREDLPPFDFIAAHGVLSWVGPAKRKAVLDFASARLKPGGLLYVGYNALPGWAAIEPLRQLLVDRGAAVGGSSIDRAREGLAFAKRLRDAGAVYFTRNPAAAEMLTTMEQTGLPYIAHEYLHAHWVPMYFTQLAAEMAEKDLYFVGQLPLHLNYRDLAVPASLLGIFDGVSDRITFETLKDYATNQFFRRDVFVKGRVLRDEAAATAYLEATPFVATAPDGSFTRDARLPHQTLHFTGPIFDALLPALAAGATSVAELSRLPTLAEFGPARVRDAVIRLTLAGQLAPTTTATRAAPAPSILETLRVPSAYNRMMLRGIGSGHPIVLASVALGTGVALSMVEAVALRLLTEVPAREWHEWLATFVRSQSVSLKVEDRVIEGEEERVRVLLSQIEPFRGKWLPRLVELGIVEREGSA